MQMPIITRRAWCPQCRTLEIRDFVPAQKPIELAFNYYAVCTHCDYHLLAAYINQSWLSQFEGLILIKCTSCNEDHDRFYLPDYAANNSRVWFTCPNTGDPLFRKTESLIFPVSGNIKTLPAGYTTYSSLDELDTKKRDYLRDHYGVTWI